MEKNINRVRWLLGLGAILIYMAGISIFSSTMLSDISKIIVNTLISVGLVIVSINVEESFKLKGLGKFSFLLGFLAFLSNFIFIGARELFGHYFSFYGAGAKLYCTFIFILVAILAHIMTLRYKDYLFVHIKYSGLLIALYTFMCHFSSNILANLSVIGVILLFFNFVKISENITRFASTTSLVYTLICSFYIYSLAVNDNSTMIFSWLIVITNAINIFLAMYKDRRVVVSLAAIVLYIFNTNLIITTFAEGFNIGIFLLITGIFYSMFEILLNYLNVIQDKTIAIALKVFFNLNYFRLFSYTGGVLDYCILATMIFGTSFINSFIYRNDKLEYTIMPLKLIFVVKSLFMVVNSSILPMSDAVCWMLIDLTFLTVMYFSKNDNHKLECIAMTLYCTYLLSFYEKMTPSLYVISGLIALLNYYFIIITSDEKTTTRGRIYYAFLLIMLLISLDNFDLNNTKYLIASLVFGLLSVSTFNDNVGFAITLPILFITLSKYIGGIATLSIEAKSFLKIALDYICFTMWINNLKVDNNSKNVFQAISLIIISLISITSGGVLNTLLTIVVAVIMTYLGIRHAEYKVLHGAGVFIVIISLLSLTSFLGEARVFIYLLLVGGGIIYSVIRLASKGIPDNTSEIKEEIVENKEQIPYDNNDQKVMFCYNCGNSLKGDETFCGKCGTKLK